MEATMVYRGYIRIMEKKMEATMVFWGYIKIMEKKMQATIVKLWETCPAGVLLLAQ